MLRNVFSCYSVNGDEFIDRGDCKEKNIKAVENLSGAQIGLNQNPSIKNYVFSSLRASSSLPIFPSLPVSLVSQTQINILPPYET